MAFELPNLPYAKDALQPYISAETLEFHHGKHHGTYVTNLNKAIEGTEFADASLEDIVKKSSGGLFNNAAQTWNHNFYWQSMNPTKTQPSADLERAIKDAFGSIDELKAKFNDASSPGKAFGSAWSWLVADGGKVDIMVTKDADTPIAHGKRPLITCDLWEHAYYIDYRNARPKYLEGWWNLVNWDFANRNFGG